MIETKKKSTKYAKNVSDLIFSTESQYANSNQQAIS